MDDNARSYKCDYEDVVRRATGDIWFFCNILAAPYDTCVPNDSHKRDDDHCLQPAEPPQRHVETMRTIAVSSYSVDLFGKIGFRPNDLQIPCDSRFTPLRSQNYLTVTITMLFASKDSCNISFIVWTRCVRGRPVYVEAQRRKLQMSCERSVLRGKQRHQGQFESTFLSERDL